VGCIDAEVGSSAAAVGCSGAAWPGSVGKAAAASVGSGAAVKGADISDSGALQAAAHIEKQTMTKTNPQWKFLTVSLVLLGLN
jgi:hypothetical protein